MSGDALHGLRLSPLARGVVELAQRREVRFRHEEAARIERLTPEEFVAEGRIDQTLSSCNFELAGKLAAAGVRGFRYGGKWYREYEGGEGPIDPQEIDRILSQEERVPKR